MLSVILLFVLLVCLCVILVLKRWKMDRMTESIPPLPGAAPVIGLAHKALHGDDVLLWERLKQWSLDTNDLGGIAKAWFGPIFFISVTDPEFFFTISNACLEKNHMYKFASRWLGRGLVTADVSTWKRHRKLLRPAFSASVVSTFLHIFNRQSRQLVSNVEHHVGGGYFDVAPYVAEISLESICQTATGLPDKDAKVVDKNYIRAMNDMLKVVLTRMSTVWMHSDFLYKFSKTKTVEDNAIKVLRKLSDHVIGKRKLARNSEMNTKLEPDQRNDSRFKPFFELIFELVDEGSLDEDEARNEVDTVVAAGYDTTQTTLLVTLLVLGSRDDVQEKVVEELTEVFSDAEEEVTKAHLSKLVYMEAVIKETLRLHPVIPLMGRVVDKDVKFVKFTLPAGSVVTLNTWGLHRHRGWGTDADVYRPERWLNASTVPDKSFAAFAMGRRSCIGKTYGMMTVKTTLAHFLRRYKVRSASSEVKFKYDVVIKVIPGQCVSLEKRLFR